MNHFVVIKLLVLSDELTVSYQQRTRVFLKLPDASSQGLCDFPHDTEIKSLLGRDRMRWLDLSDASAIISR